MCAKFSCKNFSNVYPVFWILRHYIYGAFCGHTKQWNSAYLRQGRSYQYLDISYVIWRIGMNEWLDAAADLCPFTTFRISQYIANLPWKFHEIHSKAFCTKLLTDRQTRQTNNDENITSLTEVMKTAVHSSQLQNIRRKCGLNNNLRRTDEIAQRWTLYFICMRFVTHVLNNKFGTQKYIKTLMLLFVSGSLSLLWCRIAYYKLLLPLSSEQIISPNMITGW